MIYTLTGASGNIGNRLAQQLLAAGHTVNVIGRDASRLDKLVKQGAQAQIGELNDAEFLTRAFTGSDAVFALLPPLYDSEDIYAAHALNRQAVISALKASQVKHIVALSSVGADQPEGTGVVQTLYHFEQELAALKDAHIKILRPSFFLENLFSQLPVIQHAGIVATSIAPDQAIPMIATQDIAAAAAEELLALNFSGHSVRYLLGAGDYTYPEIAEKLSKALDKAQLPYVQIPYGDEVDAISQAGLSRSAAQSLSDLNRAVNEDILLKSVVRDDSNSTPTTLADFLPVLVSAYKA